MANKPTTALTEADSLQAAIRTQLIIGWSALALFMIGGLLLEALHLFKSAAYFEVAIRRELWVLAHAHGAVLAIVNLCAGFTLRSTRSPSFGSFWMLRLALVLMPAGFFLGGISPAEADPSLWIVLTPIGAALAIIGSLRLAWALRSAAGD